MSHAQFLERQDVVRYLPGRAGEGEPLAVGAGAGLVLVVPAGAESKVYLRGVASKPFGVAVQSADGVRKLPDGLQG